MKFKFIFSTQLFHTISKRLKPKIPLILFFLFSALFIYFRDSNTSNTLTNTIDPPEYIKTLKSDLAKTAGQLKNREFILALATGERKFSPTFRNNMINTGTMHLVAISAFHTGIMIILFNLIFKFLLFFIPFRHRTRSLILFFLKVGASIFYFFITGGSIPTLRALSFILFFDFFLMKGFFPHPLTLFIFSITAVAVIIPHSIGSLSFLMSAICVATVLQIYKVLPPSVTLKLISVSAVLSYALLPVYSMISGFFPLLAPLVNLFVIPVVSISIPFITLAQFASPFSKSISTFFLHIADFTIEPAQFLITFFGKTASESLVPLIDPPFLIKVLFVITFFLSIYLRKKPKTFAIIANLTLLPFFALNFQKSPLYFSRSAELFERAYCITYQGNSGSIFFDRYKFNPKFNLFMLSRMEKAASVCSIRNVSSIHTPEKLPPATEKKIRKSKRFRTVRFYSLKADPLHYEYKCSQQPCLYYDPFL